MRTTLLAAAAAAALLTGAANAATVGSFGPATTNWTTTLSVDKADPNAGQLIQATFRLLGSVNGSARGESLDAAPSSISLNLQAAIEATSGSLLLATLPVVTETFAATAFDGVIDFGGASGASFLDRTNSDDDSLVITDPAVLALLVGPGSIDWIVAAMGGSFASGAGNVVAQFNTAAAAQLSVEYLYEVQPIPLPAALPMLAAGLAGFGFVARRRSKV